MTTNEYYQHLGMYQEINRLKKEREDLLYAMNCLMSISNNDSTPEYQRAKKLLYKLRKQDNL